ncbi:hypothetical protein K435DRAFT_869853 [Dendrothele bispora CBS 962.96]|uniref:HAT C-terminal dimerisation domain-containing protein n=1 Tax=Dendrothele bispora (strain CBS 962.96) TaxID=1314807 RepID=A0A4S8L826_DENBC|nr:hypothetical protein K435DRAFT_869853 [Dendrothele bispora CBS 962.96]
MGLADYHSAAQKRGGYVHLVKLWRDFEIEDSTGSECSNGVNGMVRLAMRILSIVPNSASTERVLSRFGSIHTKSRNRLHAEKVRSMTIVAQQIERTHGIASSSRYSKQNLGNDVDVTTPSPSPIVPSITATTVEDDIERALQEIDRQPKDNDMSVENLPRHDDSCPDDDIMGDVEDTLQSFDAVAQELIENVSLDDSEPLYNDETQGIPESEYLLENLFRFPSSQSPQPASLVFMMEFWTKGEEVMRADIQLHEQLSVPAHLRDVDDDL